MLKKLRRKFIVVAMLSVSIVLLVIVGTINIANYVTTARALEVRLQLIADNGGTFPDMMPEKPDDTLAGMEEAGKNHPQDEMPGFFREDLPDDCSSVRQCHEILFRPWNNSSFLKDFRQESCPHGMEYRGEDRKRELKCPI